MDETGRCPRINRNHSRSLRRTASFKESIMTDNEAMAEIHLPPDHNLLKIDRAILTINGDHIIINKERVRVVSASYGVVEGAVGNKLLLSVKRE